MEINLAIKCDDGIDREVKAELLDIAPHLADVATFAVFRDPFFSYLWNVTNVETGLYITKARGKRSTIKAAREKLAKQTHATLEEAFINAQKKYPWWKPQ